MIWNQRRKALEISRKRKKIGKLETREKGLRRPKFRIDSRFLHPFDGAKERGMGK